MARTLKSMATLCLATLLLAAAPAALRAHEDDDHDRARDLYEHGEIRALEDIIRMVNARVPGEIVAIELIPVDGKWIYRFQVVAADGHRSTVDVDAGEAAFSPQSRSEP